MDDDALVHAAHAFTVACYHSNAGNITSCPNVLREKGIPDININERIQLNHHFLDTSNLTRRILCVAAIFDLML